MQAAIYSRIGNEKQEQHLLRLVEILKARTKTLLYAPLYPYFSQKYGLHLASDELFGSAQELQQSSCMISVGGDGTMLDAAAMAVRSNIPIVGFSTGRLGFLPMLKDENLLAGIDNILNGNYDVEKRSMLCVHGCPDGDCIALNDICMQKRGSPIAEINVHINNEFLATYWADGLIISTPTGSTAYSLSAGGPIVSPQASCLVVMPIAAHNLNVRPVIVPDSSVITINMHTRSKAIIVSADSREYEVADDICLVVEKFSQCVKFVKLPDTNFYQNLRQKLLWGVGTRVSG
jgi:NAD+ kinase